MDAEKVREQMLAALEGAVADPAAVVAAQNVYRFVDRDGEPDGAAIAALVDENRTPEDAVRAAQDAVRARRKAGRHAAVAEARRRFGDRVTGDGQRLVEATDELERQAAERPRVSGRQSGRGEARRRFGPPKDAA